MKNSGFLTLLWLLPFSGVSQGEIQEVQIAEESISSQEQYQFNVHFFEALRLKAVGEEEEATEEFKKCLDIDPDHVAVNFEIAQYYIKNRLPKEAEEYLQTALDQDTTNIYIARAQWELAKINYDRDQERNALLHLRRLEPSNPEYVWELAMMKLASNDEDGAIADLNEVEVLMGPSDALTEQKVRIFLELGRYAEAEQELINAIARAPKRVELRGRLAEYYQNYDNPMRAIGVYEEIVRLDSLEPRANLHLAEFLYQSGRIDSSKYHLRIALGSSRLGIDPKVGVLGVFMQMADQDQSILPFAFEMLDTIIHVHPTDPKAYALKADFTVRRGQLELSRSLWKTATSLPNGSNWTIWGQILQMDTELQWWDSLHVDAQLVIARFPNRALGYLSDGSALTKLGRYDEAIAVMEEGELYGLGNPELMVQFHLQLATVYQMSGDFDMAYDYLDQVLSEYPNHPLALNNYAQYLAFEGKRLDEALEMIEKAVEAVPNQYSFWDTYAWILYIQDRPDEALNKIEKAIEFGGHNNPLVLEHKADILMALGRTPEANDVYKAAIQAGGNKQRIEGKLHAN